MRLEQEHYVGSLLQFFIGVLDDCAAQDFLTLCKARGVEPNAYTYRHDSWHYVKKQALPCTDDLLEHLFDMRIPLSFSEADCAVIGSIIAECAESIIAEIAARNQPITGVAQ